MSTSDQYRIEHDPDTGNRNHWNVYQDSVHIGDFWMANGTIYAWTSNQGGSSIAERLRGHDIGWMSTTQAAQHVYDTYHKNCASVS